MTEKLSASQLVAVRSMDAVMAVLKSKFCEEITLLRQVTFRLTRTRHETNTRTLARIRLQGSAFRGSNDRLVEVEAVMEVMEVNHLWWELQSANVLIAGDTHFALCDVVTFDDGRRIEAKIEQQSITRFPC